MTNLHQLDLQCRTEDGCGDVWLLVRRVTETDPLCDLHAEAACSQRDLHARELRMFGLPDSWVVRMLLLKLRHLPLHQLKVVLKLHLRSDIGCSLTPIYRSRKELQTVLRVRDCGTADRWRFPRDSPRLLGRHNPSFEALA